MSSKHTKCGLHHALLGLVACVIIAMSCSPALAENLNDLTLDQQKVLTPYADKVG